MLTEFSEIPSKPTRFRPFPTHRRDAAMKLVCSATDPPLGGLFVVEHLRSRCGFACDVSWGAETLVDGRRLGGVGDVARLVATELCGSGAVEATQVDHWITFAAGPLRHGRRLEGAVAALDAALAPATYLVGGRIGVADYVVFAALYANERFQAKMDMTPSNVLRWYNYMSSQEAVVNVLAALPADVKTALRRPVRMRRSSTRQSLEKPKARAQEGKFVELPGAEIGKVVVRFPPEASGYLHIGHAKAALLNQYYQEAFQGQLIMRFDDTNPAKENVHFERVILEDVAMLRIKPDRFTHTSQYFDVMIEYCERLLREGRAYVDDTDAETMKAEREHRVESRNRNNGVEENLRLWNEMKAGSKEGQRCCVRAKIDMQSANGCMRDPTIYRCKNETHPRTGDAYKVYPTYDFACPIVDAIEGVTHTLRTMEYHDRDAQFYWFIEALGLRRPYIWEYSRLSMTNTVLSKRKLTWFVENGLVDGWDDPRMPTVRGVLRRGMTVEGLKEFIVAQGSSRSVVFMEWDKIWAFNKKVIDPIAPRYTAIDASAAPVPVTVTGCQRQTVTVPRHPKNPDVGTKRVVIGPDVLIDRVDADSLKEGENATFINWGNLMIRKINRDADGKVTGIEATSNVDDKDYKKTPKITWLAVADDAPFTPTYCVYFDHLISKPLLGKDEDFKKYVGHQTRREVEMYGDPELRSLNASDIIQLQRRGFFRVDVAYRPRDPHTGKVQPLVLFSVPDGHVNENPLGLPVGERSRATVETEKKVPGKSAEELNLEITKQGDLVRSLKAEKAPKDKIQESVKVLLELKNQFKTLTGNEWKPQEVKQDQPSADNLNKEITKQGDLVRSLKAEKAPKDKIQESVKVLLELKNRFKTLTGTEWKPQEVKQDQSATNDLSNEITKQGDLVRSLKAEKAPKDKIQESVKVLLELKNRFKTLTGNEWKPQEVKQDQPSADDLSNKITKQGDLVRSLKAEKAPKDKIQESVKVLLELKNRFKTLTGNEWKPQEVKQDQPAADDLSKEITKQGDLVRSLKAEKAPKDKIQESVKVLLELKNRFKTLTGNEWKPQEVKQDQPAADDLSKEITKQGDLVRSLKAEKAPKDKIQESVKVLLELKNRFKTLTGNEWKPQEVKQDQPSGDDLNKEITKQGDLVRSLKAEKAPKDTIQESVKVLLELKNQFKTLTGNEWKPQEVKPDQSSGDDLSKEIAKQGDIVRSLKAEKAPKDKVQDAVKVLLELKNRFKTLTGTEWKPQEVKRDQTLNETTRSSARGDEPPVTGQREVPSEEDLTRAINDQGNVVRELKAKKAPKGEIDAAVKTLLELKASYRDRTGSDFPAQTQTRAPARQKEPKAKPKPAVNETSGPKKQTRLGLEARKRDNLADWYSQVITKGEMIEYYDVSGCYILRPWSFAVWESIRDWLDGEIKKLGVQNCYFPIFVSAGVLEREKDHIADFAPEVAWVTRSGDSELAEPIAVRPTSETVMYPAYAKWIQSYRDLPIKLNQWNNVVRWEFKHPQPFLRTREFLWQEGHTAYADEAEARKEVETIIDLYAKVYTDLLAVPVVRGRKTEKEKFAGGDYTLTVEAFVSASGRGIQAATSHHLAQNFSRMFDVSYEDPDTQERRYVYQNSWGITTRTIGVMIMVHSDDRGLVLPPRVAAVQVVIVPCGITVDLTEAKQSDLLGQCATLERELVEEGVRARGDHRMNYSPGWKFNHWELKGVPIRVELGPRDIEKEQLVAVRRDTGEKLTLPRGRAVPELKKLLEEIQGALYKTACGDMNSHIVRLADWSRFAQTLDAKNLILAPFCGDVGCEDRIKAESAREDDAAEPGAPSMGAKTLCIPSEQPEEIRPNQRCIHPACGRRPLYYALFGRSY